MRIENNKKTKVIITHGYRRRIGYDKTQSSKTGKNSPFAVKAYRFGMSAIVLSHVQ